MLFEPAHDALRACLTAEFSAHAHGVKDAAEIGQLIRQLILVASGILCDLASTWSESHNTARRLPPEILAACFATLEEFPDRMAVSHVSRAWRSAALAHPAIWAHIDFTMKNFRDEPALLQMALSRTGRYPVELCLPAFDADYVVSKCVAQHMAHIKAIEWALRDRWYHLRLPAPMLEIFTGMEDGSVIYDDFLGGQIGRLRELNLPSVRFPSTCPALSTVTHLSLSFPDNHEHAATYSRLFQLFPLLQSLDLHSINLVMARYLPSGPAPPSLDILNLESQALHHDLIRYFLDWKSDDNLRDVTLAVHGLTALNCRLQDLISGAVELAVSLRGGPVFATASILARCPGQRTRALEFANYDTYEGSEPAEVLVRAQSALHGVRALEIPAHTLGAFVRRGVFSVLPQLAELIICVKGDADHEFDWASLGELKHALEARPQLTSVVIAVACDEGKDDWPLDTEDARALLDVFATFSVELPPIIVKGFTHDVAQDAQIYFDSLGIRFDCDVQDAYDI